MKNLVVLSGLILFVIAPARADEVTRNAQAELKSEGFFYGEADGNLTTETSAALKRYQIRNGLEVTGTLTHQTLETLGLVAKKASPAAIPPPAEATPPPPANQRPTDAIAESDRQFLRRDEQPAARPENPPAPAQSAPGADYAGLFARTPFATAPLQVQQSTVRKAQTFLAREGMYRDRIDGAASGDLEEALLTYQRRSRLPLTGRLDLETLNKMRLLPGRGGPPLQPFNAGQRPGIPPKTYRGIWVD